MVAGLPAEFGIAALAFVGTNIDNVLVTTAMVATAPPERARRIAAGQVVGFAVLILVAVATAIALFDVPTRAIGLLGLVPLALGIHGLFALRHPDAHQRAARRAFGKGVIAAALVTIGAGGDNLAVYIPLFRSANGAGRGATALAFLIGEVLLTLLVLNAGRHPRTRAAVSRIGTIATPLLYCAIGVFILIDANTFSFLG
jgi:cadmium resistance protein CadD (predicted permease)